MIRPFRTACAALVAALGLVCLLVGLTGILSTELRAEEPVALSPGDRVRVTVFGETDLSGEFELGGAGSFAMPLVGAIDARRLDARQLESRIAERLRDGFLRDPKVSVEILSLQPVYVLGEVNQPGSYPYRAGLSILTAAAMAGGFTYRADEDDIEVTRGGGRPRSLPPHAAVRPGDVIRVGERFF